MLQQQRKISPNWIKGLEGQELPKSFFIDTIFDASLDSASLPPPPFWLKYFSLYYDYSIVTPHDSISSRYVVAQLEEEALISIPVKPADQIPIIPNPEILSIIEELLSEVPLYHFQVFLNTKNIPFDGSFGSISIFETEQPYGFIECTTTVFSAGKVVLKTKELKTSITEEGRYFYNFEILNQFFETFLDGIRGFENELEKITALRNIIVVQVFEIVNFQSLNFPLYSVLFEFEDGDGSVMIESIEH